MPLSHKPFPDINADDVQRLITSGVPEGLRIDYKRDTYKANDGREFLKDISSFANTRGGYLLIGVTEENGILHIYRRRTQCRDRFRDSETGKLGT